MKKCADWQKKLRKNFQKRYSDLVQYDLINLEITYRRLSTPEPSARHALAPCGTPSSSCLAALSSPIFWVQLGGGGAWLWSSSALERETKDWGEEKLCERQRKRERSALSSIQGRRPIGFAIGFSRNNLPRACSFRLHGVAWKVEYCTWFLVLLGLIGGWRWSMQT
jgi:hypothetical protein